MLNAQQINRFLGDGLLVVPDVIDAKTLRAVREDYFTRTADLCRRYRRLGYAIKRADNFADNLTALLSTAPAVYEHLDISLPMLRNMASRVGDWQKLFGDEWRQEAGFFLPDSVFRLLSHPPVLQIASQLLGDEIQLSPVQHVRIKPPQRLLPAAAAMDANMSRTLWHQDEAVVSDSAAGTTILTVWVAVSDATVENGCMQAIAGSHLPAAAGAAVDGGLAAHCPGKAGLAAEIYIPDDAVDKKNLIPLTASAGSLVLLNQRTIHGAGENQSDGVRWSFDLRYQKAATPSGRDCFPSCLLAGKKTAVVDNGEDYRRLWRDARDDIIGGKVQAVFNGRWEKYQNTPLCA